MSTDLLLSTLDTRGGKRIGVAVLNRPDKLNALTLSMCRQLDEQLLKWEQDDSVALVILTGKGDRAFCAGGDLRELAASLKEFQSDDPWDHLYAREFFADEYRLDYRIHRYSKPILCWASDIVMGGGVGLMMGASHRVATETTRFAMPETAIGVFPDVGGSWMLERLPAGIGMFLALTGAQLGASDCRYLGLVDYALYSESWSLLKQELIDTHWTDDRHDNDILLDRVLRSNSISDLGRQGPLQEVYERVAELCDGPDFDAICTAILRCQDASNNWLARSAQAFARASPGSVRLTFTLLRTARGLSLAEVFRMEYTAMLRAIVGHDFAEGVRAVLVDKDRSPRWQHESFHEADRNWAQQFFVPSWPADVEHPLANLAAYNRSSDYATIQPGR